MQNTEQRSAAPELLIFVGSSFFILVLAVSAYWQSDIRWLHFFQAWMYVTTIILAFRRNRWGYFIGLSAAGLWDYTNIFATTFLFNGLQELSRWIHSGHLARPDLLIAIPAWLSNFLVVAGCLWGYSQERAKRLTDLGRFFLSFALTNRLFRARYGVVPTTLPRDLSPAATPAFALSSHVVDGTGLTLDVIAWWLSTNLPSDLHLPLAGLTRIVTGHTGSIGGNHEYHSVFRATGVIHRQVRPAVPSIL